MMHGSSRMTSLTTEAPSVGDITAAFVHGEPRIRTERAATGRLAVAVGGGDHRVGRDVVLDPRLECMLHVEYVRARAAAAVCHAGYHEQAIELLHVGHRAAHRLVVVDAEARRDEV